MLLILAIVFALAAIILVLGSWARSAKDASASGFDDTIAFGGDDEEEPEEEELYSKLDDTAEEFAVGSRRDRPARRPAARKTGAKPAAKPKAKPKAAARSAKRPAPEHRRFALSLAAAAIDFRDGVALRQILARIADVLNHADIRLQYGRCAFEFGLEAELISE